MYRSLFFNKFAGLKFPCEFWEIFENIFITEHLRATASSACKKYLQTQPVFTCSNSTIETPEQCMKSVQI